MEIVEPYRQLLGLRVPSTVQRMDLDVAGQLVKVFV